MKYNFTILISCFFITLTTFSQKLDDAKKDLNTQSQTSSTTQSSRRNSSRNSSNNTKVLDSYFDNIFMELFFNLTYGIAIESVFERNSEMHYADYSIYPYYENNTGNFTYSKDYVKTRFDVSSNLIRESKNLYGNNLNLKLFFLKRMDIEAGYLQLIEKVNNQTDSFALFSAMVNYHRIRTQKFDLWFGLGTMYVGNTINKYGFAYGIGAEWYLAKPISILGSYKGTSINQRTIDKSKILLKYHIKNYNIATGFENYTLGISDINAFTLGFGISF